MFGKGNLDTDVSKSLRVFFKAFWHIPKPPKFKKTTKDLEFDKRQTVFHEFTDFPVAFEKRTPLDPYLRPCERTWVSSFFTISGQKIT